MVAPFLNKDELALYKLIWQRFVACQMAAALFAETIIDIDVRERYIFRTTGLVLKFAGFLSVYVEGKDEKDEDEPESLIPVVTEGEVLTLQKLAAEQSFTRPPARYTEATLVKALEEKGIGRPSTYAQILQVIQNRSYVEKRENRFHPTELGLVVNEVLVGNFDKLFNVSYTAQLEQQLDDIEEGNQAWQKIIEQFYKTFSQDLAAAEENIVKAREGVMTEEVCHRCSTLMMLKLGRFGRYLSCTNKECKATRDPQPKKAAEVETLEAPTCENCGKAMELKRGRWGQFFACTGYPECKTTRKLTPTAAAAAKKPDVPLTELCPDCGNNLAMKSGRYGDFVSCSNYPTCKYIKRETTGIACPTEGCKGQLRVNKSRRGKAFYGCSTYPKCKTVFWDKPLATPCPKCHAPFIFEKVTKRSGTENYCSQCTYRVTVAEPPSEGIIDVPALTPVSADPSPVSADPSLA
jgi:DNA topoisomerase-1